MENKTNNQFYIIEQHIDEEQFVLHVCKNYSVYKNQKQAISDLKSYYKLDTTTNGFVYTMDDLGYVTAKTGSYLDFLKFCVYNLAKYGGDEILKNYDLSNAISCGEIENLLISREYSVDIFDDIVWIGCHYSYEPSFCFYKQVQIQKNQVEDFVEIIVNKHNFEIESD